MTKVNEGRLNGFVGQLLQDPGGAALKPLNSCRGMGIVIEALPRTLVAALLLLAVGAPAQAAPAAGIEPVRDKDFYQNGRFSEPKVALGRLLFFDKVLSGNRNISCATCHHPTLGTGDGQALSLGEGAAGLGKARRTTAENPVLGRVPRNSQPLYFLGAKAFTRLFHDGRLEVDPRGTWPSGFWSPAREQLPDGLDNVLAAQAMFPVTSDIEMAGHKGENAVATAAALDRLAGPEGVWDHLARRLRDIPAYVGLFREAYPEIRQAADMTFVQAANAIAAFEAAAFRPDGSPFDRYLETRDPDVLGPAAKRGIRLFYGRARCADCHSGKFLTDQRFHAVAMPQIGPGKNDGWDQSYWEATGFSARLQDFGRFRVTHDPRDKFRFRTPSLRNVELSGPWGHAGAYDTLEAVVRHHLNPVASLERFDSGSVPLARLDRVIEATAQGSRLSFGPVNPARLGDHRRRDAWVQQTAPLRRAIADANELPPIDLTDAEVSDLVAFLKSLTDPRSRDRSELIPERVPSGLPVSD